MRRLAISLLLFIFSVPGVVCAQSQVWDLPLSVNDNNTSVKFEVDTTWHVVYGEVKNKTGSIILLDSENPLSVKSEIHFPVKSFSTGWGMRDDSLYEHMAEEKYPEVVFKSQNVLGDCTPEKVHAAGQCSGELEAVLTIRDVSKKIALPVVITAKDSEYVVSGEYSFKWAQYNVEDPSIIMAKVEPIVKVIYSVTVPAKAVSPETMEEKAQ